MCRVSFIIPVYNCKQYLTGCIGSIEEIQLDNYEVLLIDDGSTDGSGDLCDVIAHKNHCVRCYHQKNRGVSAARNYGLRKASGDYIVFLDADDSFNATMLASLLNMVENHQEIDLAIYGMTFDYYFRGRCYRRDSLHCDCSGIMDRTRWGPELVQMYTSNALSPVWNKIFRRDIIVKGKLYFREDMFLYEDLEYSLRYLSFCKNIYISSECIYHYRQSEDEGNAGRRLKRIEKLTEVVDHIEAALDELIIAQKIDDQSQKIKSILLELYCVIAREKIAIASRKEIGKICVDFADWMSKRDVVVPEKHVAFINMIIQKKVSSFVWQRRYTRCRHKIAVWIKSTMIYRKFHEKR